MLVKTLQDQVDRQLETIESASSWRHEMADHVHEIQRQYESSIERSLAAERLAERLRAEIGLCARISRCVGHCALPDHQSRHNDELQARLLSLAAVHESGVAKV